MAMDFDDVIKMKMAERDEHSGWGLSTAAYLIVAAIVLAVLVYLWHKGCDEKAQLAAGVSKLSGRVDAIEPAVTAQGNNLYKLNGNVIGTMQSLADVKEAYGYDIAELNGAVFTSRGRSGCGGCGNREFKQSSTYNLASTQVTVDETCRG